MAWTSCLIASCFFKSKPKPWPSLIAVSVFLGFTGGKIYSKTTEVDSEWIDSFSLGLTGGSIS